MHRRLSSYYKPLIVSINCGWTATDVPEALCRKSAATQSLFMEHRLALVKRKPISLCEIHTAATFSPDIVISYGSHS